MREGDAIVLLFPRRDLAAQEAAAMIDAGSYLQDSGLSLPPESTVGRDLIAHGARLVDAGLKELDDGP